MSLIQREYHQYPLWDLALSYNLQVEKTFTWKTGISSYRVQRQDEKTFTQKTGISYSVQPQDEKSLT